MRNLHQSRAFTLIEVLVVLGILSLLVALLVPVFFTVQGRARQTTCASNLRQIGQGFVMYAQDHDGRFLYAVDPVDRVGPSLHAAYPEFASNIAHIGSIQQVLQPYVGSPKLFACPADIGFKFEDFSGVLLDAYPSSFEKYGTSYYYRTELAARKMNESGVEQPEKINVLTDGAGHWHGTLVPVALRYNVLFADGHVKNCSPLQVAQAWRTPLNASIPNSYSGSD